MSHNANPRKRRQAVLSGTLGEFSAWTLSISCGGSQHQRILPVADLLVIYDDAIRIGSLIGRLRCSPLGCGAAPSRIVIQTRLHEVILVGQGAFG